MAVFENDGEQWHRNYDPTLVCCPEIRASFFAKHFIIVFWNSPTVASQPSDILY